MSVYKASYCYPFQNAIDPRVTNHIYANVTDIVDTDVVSRNFKCKINTSNTKITGYHIRILDNNNNVIFDPKGTGQSGNTYIYDKISPISALNFITKIITKALNTYEPDINTGLNNSLLYIPFFQSFGITYSWDEGSHSYKPQYTPSIHASYNAIYFGAKYSTKFFINTSEATSWDYVEGEEQLDDTLTQSSWQGSINDEIALVGDSVFVMPDPNAISGIEKGGIWIVKEFINGTCVLKRACNSLADPLTTANIINCFILITGIKYHNEPKGYFDHDTIPEFHKFLDIEGKDIENLDFDISSYKWEITLYQGEVKNSNEGVQKSTATDQLIPIISYEGLDPKNYDIILNSGTILGSTDKRIQIANTNAPFNTSIVTKIPQGTNNNPLVLQGRYMQLYSTSVDPNDPSHIITSQLGNRAYVVSYDSTNGHVYPETGIINISDINNPIVDKVAFFKHSNNEEAILASERVTCATYDENIPYLYDPKHSTGSPPIDGVQVTEGMYVLLKNQTNAQENGIYIVHIPSGKEESGTVVHWTRSGAYNTWGKFIGAIIFVTSGQHNYGKNFESAAQPGGTLYVGTHDQVDMGAYSQLFFTEERKIILFDDEITQTVDAYRDCTLDTVADREIIFNPGEKTSCVQYSESAKLQYALSDGISPWSGQTILYRNHNGSIIQILSCIEYSRISDTTDTNITVVWELKETINSSNIYKILNGKYYAGTLIMNGSIYEELNYAYILKNTNDITYISPYIDIDKDMMLKLKNNKWRMKKDEVELLEPVNMFKISNFNKTVYAVKLNYILAKNDQEYKFVEPLPSVAIDVKSNNAPFKYDIKSFFRTSDENPFWIIENPILDIINGENIYKPLIVKYDGDDAYFIVNTESQYQVSEQRDIHNWPYRYISIKAAYTQFQEGYWESYQFELYDQNGNLLQDTGVRYDKDIQATFYGLTAQYNRFRKKYESSTYTIKCNVVDSYHNNLSFNIDYTISNDISIFTPIGEKYTGTFDKDTHSIIITPEQTESQNTKYISIYRREYTELYQPSHINEKQVKIVAGPWYCVASAIPRQTNSLAKIKAAISIRDFNIQSGRSYQYVIYPLDDTEESGEVSSNIKFFEQMVNATPEDAPSESGELKVGLGYGTPIKTNFDAWSITELIPIQVNLSDNIPSTENIYKVDTDNIWLFKFGLETGAQTQNLSRGEMQTLGQYPKIGYGKNDYVSGDVTGLLGSEIIPYYKNGYIERLRSDIKSPATTNSKVHMLEAWRKFAFSKNPKLLKDMKGQSWIVQIMSSTNTPKIFYKDQPDTINFSWKQIGSTERVMIYSTEQSQSESLPIRGQCGSNWEEFHGEFVPFRSSILYFEERGTRHGYAAAIDEQSSVIYPSISYITISALKINY